MKEFQTVLTIKDAHGDKHIIVLRGNVTAHSTCSATHESQIGMVVFWHSSSHYSWPKREGVIIDKKQRIWDYSLPIGKRAIPIL